MRTPSHYEADTRRTLRAYDPGQLRSYIARHAIQICVAEDMLRAHPDGDGQGMISPTIRKALVFTRDAVKNLRKQQKAKVA